MIRTAVLVIALTLLFMAIWAIKDEKINKKIKAIISSFLILLIGFAYIYESDFDDKSTKNMQILTNFNQGKTIICGDYNVTKEKFNYEFGTAVFIAKREFAELSGVIIPIVKCINEK